MKPNPNTIHPINGYEKEIYVKPTITNPNIVVGNPAKPIRKRFDDEMIQLLLDWKWWDKSIDEINDLIPMLTSNKLDDVKNKVKELLNTYNKF